MPSNQASRFHPHALAALVLLVGLLATWFAYAPGLGGTLHFDDHHNLGGLSSVHDSPSAFRFAATGKAGPVGRHIALASFVPQAYAWPHATEVLLRTNILIHLLNGVLVTWFLYLLGRARNRAEQLSALTAVGAGAIWMLMPLLASSSLFIVQRMTTLSAVFTLLGAIGYLYARQGIDQRPGAALAGMTLALGFGATLGVLTKENGALIFLFILAVEAILDSPRKLSQRLWQTWFSIVLIGPLLVLLFYLVSVLPYPESVVLRRDFTGFERLITQAEILWKYLYLAFLPSISNLGPFHDDYPIQRTFFNGATMLAIGAWVLVISAAVSLRKRTPLFTFAVAWFLLGHLLESTTVPLELYFEHRNYLPLVGPVYALAAYLSQLEQKRRLLAGAGATSFAAILGLVLFSSTSLWGSPTLAAEMWHMHKPGSMRATQHLAGALEREGYPFAARRLLNQYIETHPEADGVRLQVLMISCQLDPEFDADETLRLLEERFRVVQFNHSVPAVFQQFDNLVRESRCPNTDISSVYALGQSLLDNPSFTSPIIRHNIHVVMARTGIDRKDFGATMMHMEKALDYYHHPNTLLLTIGILNSGGRYDLARSLHTEARNRKLPRHPLRALQWEQELERIDDLLVTVEQSHNQLQHAVN